MVDRVCDFVHPILRILTATLEQITSQHRKKVSVSSDANVVESSLLNGVTKNLMPDCSKNEEMVVGVTKNYSDLLGLLIGDDFRVGRVTERENVSNYIIVMVLASFLVNFYLVLKKTHCILKAT